MNKRRHNLFKANPNCHWCGRLTVLYGWMEGAQKADCATVDHIKSRLDPDRMLMSAVTANQQTVLACYECNQRRNTEENKILKPIGLGPGPGPDGVMTYIEYLKRVEYILNHCTLRTLREASSSTDPYFAGYNAAVADLKKNIFALRFKWKFGGAPAPITPNPPLPDTRSEEEALTPPSTPPLTFRQWLKSWL